MTLLNTPMYISSIASRSCSNYIFIRGLTLGVNKLCKDNCKTSRNTFKFRDLMRLVLAVWRNFMLTYSHTVVSTSMFSVVAAAWQIIDRFVFAWNGQDECCCSHIIPILFGRKYKTPGITEIVDEARLFLLCWSPSIRRGYEDQPQQDSTRAALDA